MRAITTECIMKYVKHQFANEYENGNIAFQEKLISLSIIITLNVPIYEILNELWTSLSLTQEKFK